MKAHDHAYTRDRKRKNKKKNKKENGVTRLYKRRKKQIQTHIYFHISSRPAPVSNRRTLTCLPPDGPERDVD